MIKYISLGYVYQSFINLSVIRGIAAETVTDNVERPIMQHYSP